MSNVIQMKAVNFKASDVSGQHAVNVNRFPQAAFVGEMVRELVGQMGLASQSPGGQPYTYHARLDRVGRHLRATEVVGEVIEEGDQISLHPNIDAGAR